MLNRKVVSFLTALFLVILISFSWIFFSSQARVQQAEKEAIKLIGYDYTVKEVKQFYWTTIGQAYFALDFIDDSGVEHYAIVAREGGTVHYYTPDQIISAEDAKSITVADTGAKRIMQARLGMMKETPVWEVTIKNDNNTLTYYYVNANDGSWVQKIENI